MTKKHKEAVLMWNLRLHKYVSLNFTLAQPLFVNDNANFEDVCFNHNYRQLMIWFDHMCKYLYRYLHSHVLKYKRFSETSSTEK